MDLEDWELLNEEDHEVTMEMIRNTDMDYFICPSQKIQLDQKPNVVPTEVLQVPIAWEPMSTVEDKDHKNNNNPDQDVSDPAPELSTDFPSPRITFKKTKETEFADMKIEMFTAPLHQNEEKDSQSEEGLGGDYDYERVEEEGNSDVRSKKEVNWDDEDNKIIGGERMNLWKIGLNGIGAICSFGVAAAAATICALVLGHNNNNNIKGCRNKNQILRFQICSDDNKRMNEVVKHATKLNDAISVMKSLPVARAQISFGGYYDGL